MDGWDVKSNDDKSFYLIKNFKFDNFLLSQEFINKVGKIADLVLWSGHPMSIYSQVEKTL